MASARAEIVARANAAHAICSGCWKRLYGRLGEMRSLREIDWERCCFCGGLAHHGLYRQDADPLEVAACHGHTRRLDPPALQGR
jgi:hypothetical protein